MPLDIWTSHSSTHSCWASCSGICPGVSGPGMGPLQAQKSQWEEAARPDVQARPGAGAGRALRVLQLEPELLWPSGCPSGPIPGRDTASGFCSISRACLARRFLLSRGAQGAPEARYALVSIPLCSWCHCHVCGQATPGVRSRCSAPVGFHCPLYQQAEASAQCPLPCHASHANHANMDLHKQALQPSVLAPRGPGVLPA